jgi:hypothetical protein
MVTEVTVKINSPFSEVLKEYFPDESLVAPYKYPSR